MNKWADPIVADVRRNREALLADFSGDIHKLIQYLKEQSPKKDAAGWKAVTIDEIERSRIMSDKQGIYE
jgi:hypothetical protein